MSVPDTRTRRPVRRRRRTTAGGRLLTLLLVLGGVTAALAALIRLVGPGGEQARAAREAAAATPTAIPTVSPEPTPALPAVDIQSWELRMVRFEYPLGEDFAPPSLEEVGDGEQMDSRVAPFAVQLLSDAKAAGYTVWVCSGYRDYDTQHLIYWNHIYEYTEEGMTEEEAHAKTRLAVNYPGSSEHQSGLCMDVLESRDQDMEPYIGGSGLMLWLEQHCAEYGFVVRYPNGKTDITGIEYEPWHLRYVGRDAAEYMMQHGLCLEEFLALYGGYDLTGQGA